VRVANPFIVNGDAEKRRAEATQYAREIEHLTASLRNLGEYYPDFHAPMWHGCAFCLDSNKEERINGNS
jgi:hypothetical protein